MAELPHTDSTQAMQSILSAYADNADDDDDDEDRPIDNISGSDDENSSQYFQAKTSVETPVKEIISFDDEPPAKMKALSKAPATKLVSYGDVDDDLGEHGGDEDPSIHGSEYDPVLVQYDVSMVEPEAHDDDEKSPVAGNKSNKIELPPEPTAKCSNKLQEKISKLYQKMRSGMDLNASIQNRKDFRNPSIYEKLIQFCNLDEKGTNYPPELYNPMIWGKESFYDELAKAQKTEMDKREKEKKERTKVEFVTGTKRQTPDGPVVEQKRKSKWDAHPPIPMVSKPVVITTTAINPPVVSVTTSSSGVKTAVISVTGTLKKPK